MKIRCVTVLTVLLVGTTCYSQTDPQVFSTAGGEGSSATAQTTWTIGEPVTATLTSGSNVLTQGYQQPWADVIIGVDDINDPNYDISVYPNPTQHILNVVYANETMTDDKLELMDAQGRMIRQDQVMSTTTELDMTPYGSGSYFLRILDRTGNLKRAFTINVTH